MSKYKSPTFSEFLNEKFSEVNGPEVASVGRRETLSDAQYALMYLLFKGKTNLLQQPYRSMDDKTLRIMGGLSDQTARHRLREMKILAGQEDAAQRGDEYYEEILSKVTDRENMDPNDMRRTARHFYEFQEMDPAALVALASEAFTEENQERGQHFYDKNIERQNKYAQDMKQKVSSEKKKIQQFVSDYVKAFSKNQSFSDAKRKAIAQAVAKFGKTEAEIAQIVAGK